MHELLLKILAVLAKVGTLREQLPSVLVDSCLYYCCTTHQALAALRSLCTEGCVRSTQSTCVGIRNVIREFIWTAATLLCAQIRTGFMTSTVHVTGLTYVYPARKGYNPLHITLPLLQFLSPRARTCFRVRNEYCQCD